MATIGLVVCGGKSIRMGTDKSQLQYFGIPQAEHVYNLLMPFCEKVFISCNKSQSEILNKQKILTDLPHYENIGPMASLLTAFDQHPGNDFLLIGCDYPFLTSQDILNFFSKTKRDSLAAAFYNDAGKYEPMLAWYAKETAPLLLKRFEEKHYSLQYFLQEIKAEKYIPESKEVMISVDTREDFERVKALINVDNTK
ncbi:molybdenum cofactor guanylyltransferase [Dyadobacter sp. CY326]|uniref:molybdenum cofactor guanylyltransferase n=1 Tax=Dyadobacter sp. CY326 TaxID=2907300 RepID=UPI001F25B849|nr:molybdenum cofactor guanylyltransferase [Dyadobacter sp. CY326]MCE7064330.1 molybdenum cofactor guanylyltransferase [Dyadobacter sp. CY326]